MKMSAWIRFCLIVLCLAMACSMFACRNPEEQTTEKPEQVTTEAPSVEKPTEQPTEKPTETPTTEAPVTETTEAPATETTEAPVTETTEAPATETTEAPATETTEEVTNTYLEEETIVIGGIEYVEEAASPYAYNIDSHGGAPGQTIIATADNFNQVVSGLKGWIAIRPGILKYVYAIVVDGVQGEWIDFTKTMLPDGSNTVGYDRPDIIKHITNNLPGFESVIAGTNCGFNFTHTLDLSQYHGNDVSIVYYAVVYKTDTAGNRVVVDSNGNYVSVYPSYRPNEEGTIVFAGMSDKADESEGFGNLLVDAEGNVVDGYAYVEGAWINMATAIDVMPEHYGVGEYRDNGDGTHSIKCEGCNEYYITEACNPAFGSGATAKDTATHTGMTCGLCHQTGIEGPHSAPSNYVWDDEKGIYTTYYNEVVWDEEQGKYISVCIACNGQVGDAFEAIHSVELETITMGGVWETVQSNEETYAIITMKAGLQDSKWRATYFKVNPNGLRTGQYIAIRYMIPTEGANPTHFTIVNGGWSVDVPVIADGEWHIVLVEAPGKDASFAIPSGDTRLNFIGAYTGWNEGDQICLDWLKTYDSVEAIKLDLQIGQEACACPAWAIEVVEYAGVESHSVRCTICGKMDTAAHTPSSTLGVAVEGGYAKVCSVCGGATAEPAMGNYVFDKADLLNGIHSTSLTKEETETGVKFTNPDAGDRNFTVFQNVTGVETGKYLFFKYRADASSVSAFTASDYAAPTGARNYGLTLDCDGAWHIAIVEIPLVAEDGKYYAQHLRVDVEGSVGAWMELEYIGYANNAITLAKAIDALDSGADDICECPALFAGNASYADKDTHSSVCQLCNKTNYSSHIGAKFGSWNEELEYYVSNTECTTCGELYNFGATVKMQSSSIWGSASSWNITLSYTENGTWLLTKKNDAGVWAESHLKINPDQVVTGQYIIIKYKAKGHTGTFNMPFSAGSLKSGAYSGTTLPIVFDEAEHVIILDLSTLANYTANDDGTYSYGHFDKARMTWSNLPKGANIEFTSIAMYDHIDRLPTIPEADCPHPTFALQGEEIDAETHGSICQLCNKVLDTADHTYPITAAYDSELEYYVHACTVCGYTKRAVANVFMDADAILASASVNANLSMSEGDEGGAKFTQLNDKDANANFFQGWAGTVETGNYLFFKYRTSGDVTSFQIFTSTVAGNADGSYQHKPALDLSAGWHLAIIDLNAAQNFAAAEDSKYYAKHLRFDVENGVGGDWMEIAYVGLANDLDALIESLQYLDADIDDICPCGEFLATIVSNGVETHSLTCKLCGTTGDPVAHTGAYGVWNETESKYLAVCGVCGGNTNIDYGCTVGGEAEDLFTDLNQWNLYRSVQDGYVNFKKNAGDTFCATYFQINPTGAATGKYLVVKYRANAAAADAFYIKYTSGGKITGVNIESDGEWHIAIVQLETGFTDGDVRLMLYHPNGTTTWGAGESLDIDWVRMYDGYSRIPGVE